MSVDSSKEGLAPIALRLFCPECGFQHIDEGEWATRPHRTHLCLNCGIEWRVSPDFTVGVRDHSAARKAEARIRELEAVLCDHCSGCRRGLPLDVLTSHGVEIWYHKRGSGEFPDAIDQGCLLTDKQRALLSPSTGEKAAGEVGE